MAADREDILARLVRAGHEIACDIIAASGPMLTRREVLELTGWRGVDLDRRAGAKGVLAVKDPDSEDDLFPAWQFSGGKVIPGFRDVLEILDPANPVEALVFFQTPVYPSQKSPIEMLRAGDKAGARLAAKQATGGHGGR